MINGKINLSGNLSIRVADGKDKAFIDKLFNSTRNDLRLINAERDFIEELIFVQQKAQKADYENRFPNAYNFIVDYHQSAIGRVMVDFGENEIHVVDISFLPEAQGHGYGAMTIKALQNAAQQVMAPITLWIHRGNIKVQQFYVSLGFASLGGDAMNEKLAWFPVSVHKN